MNELEVLTPFQQDVMEGLKGKQKRLSSRYFYDETGDALFQRIMNLDEYYLTRAEYEVFVNHKEEILRLMSHGEQFRIVELGAGDGFKTKVLLKHFIEEGANFTYSPVDISANVLEILEKNLLKDLPNLSVRPLTGDYFDVLSNLRFRTDQRTIIYFLGSNIGNFSHDTAISFLTSVKSNLKTGDRMMIGFDLKKNPHEILAAYNDSSGVTKEFNLNLLRRINREMDANFDVNQFEHYPVYDPMTGECRSYLMSLADQHVTIRSMDETISFKKWETIFVEISRKYDLDEIHTLAEKAGFFVAKDLFDSHRKFVDSIWEIA